MKHNEEKLESLVGRESGMTVPPGYFDSIRAHISSRLPERKIEPVKAPTTWQKVRPYLYMAAMFAGIWCMMKVFYSVSTPQDVNIFPDASEQFLAEVVQMDYTHDDFAPDYGSDDYQLEATVADEYGSFEEIEDAMGFTLKPEYEQLQVN